MKLHTKNIITCQIGSVTVKDLGYAKINSLNILYLIADKINSYI